MGETLLTIRQVCERTGYSRAGLYRAMQAGEFPRPLKRGNASLWVESEVQAAIDRQVETLPRMGACAGRPRKAA